VVILFLVLGINTPFVALLADESIKLNESVSGFLREEQKPLNTQTIGKTETKATSHGYYIFVVCLVLVLAGACTFFVIRFLRRNGGFRGSRKFLIEQLSYCPLGTKMGVALLKIGREFILVGVTPNQINILSNMPVLAEQYGEEAKYERDHFDKAVKEELSRISR